MREIQQADPQARRRAVVIWSAGAVIGALVLFGGLPFIPALVDWAAGNPALVPWRLKLVLGVLGAMIAAPLCVAAVYCWRLGGRVVQSRRFPPPGVPVIRDTRVLHDRDAEIRGRRLRLFAVFLLAAACALTVQLWLVAASFRKFAP